MKVNGNLCPKCFGKLLGKENAFYLGYCQKCEADVVIRVRRRNDPLRQSMLELHADYLSKRVKELEGKKR